MKIALTGYGKMGHMIEQIAKDRGHEVVCIIDKDNTADFNSEAFRSADCVIEFSTPDTAVGNAEVRRECLWYAERPDGPRQCPKSRLCAMKGKGHSFSPPISPSE